MVKFLAHHCTNAIPLKFAIPGPKCPRDRNVHGTEMSTGPKCPGTEMSTGPKCPGTEMSTGPKCPDRNVSGRNVWDRNENQPIFQPFLKIFFGQL